MAAPLSDSAYSYKSFVEYKTHCCYFYVTTRFSIFKSCNRQIPNKYKPYLDISLVSITITLSRGCFQLYPSVDSSVAAVNPVLVLDIGTDLMQLQ